LQLGEHLGARGSVVHDADEDRSELHVGNVLGHVAAHAAVHRLHPPGVAPGGVVYVVREALDVQKHRADHYHRHKPFLLAVDLILSYHI